MKTAISIPDKIFTQAEKLAERLGMSRSELYTKAVSNYVEKNKYVNVKDKLDEIYSREQSETDEILSGMQRKSANKD